jgi:sodium/potassium-transporting ATPase subunit alpha
LLYYRRPLGDPNPAVANLALAVVLLIVIAIQACFNAWQGKFTALNSARITTDHLTDYSTGRVMASIFGMLPTDVLVRRDGNISKFVP